MEDWVLDTSQKRINRYTVKWAALTGSLLSLLTVAIVLCTIYYCPIPEDLLNHPLTLYIVFLTILTPAFIVMFLIAAYGNRTRHFAKILFSGLFCWQITILNVLLVGNILVIFEEGIHISTRSEVITDLLELNIAVFIFALILWLIPGKLTYFRKQMEP